MHYNIQIDAAIPNIKAANKIQVFRALASKAAASIGCCEEALFTQLCEKEQQSKSGIGRGVAIPHFKTPLASQRYVALTTLSNPVNFEAMDEQNVDLICMLISPENHGGLHLRGLSRISRILRSEKLCSQLRDAQDEDTLCSLFENPDGWLLAA